MQTCCSSQQKWYSSRFQRTERRKFEAYIYLGARSNGAVLLQLTAFEILLKALCYSVGHEPERTHDYPAHFAVLPAHMRERLISDAAMRLGRPLNGYNAVLKALYRNFTALRYPYSAYIGKSDAQVLKWATTWRAKVAKRSNGDDDAAMCDPSILEGAAFVYFPEELCALSAALENEIEVWLEATAALE